MKRSDFLLLAAPFLLFAIVSVIVYAFSKKRDRKRAAEAMKRTIRDADARQLKAKQWKP